MQTRCYKREAHYSKTTTVFMKRVSKVIVARRPQVYPTPRATSPLSTPWTHISGYSKDATSITVSLQPNFYEFLHYATQLGTTITSKMSQKKELKRQKRNQQTYFLSCFVLIFLLTATGVTHSLLPLISLG